MNLPGVKAFINNILGVTPLWSMIHFDHHDLYTSSAMAVFEARVNENHDLK